MNDALGAYRKMRRIHDAFPMALASSRVRAADQFGVEQAGERQTTEAVGGLAEKGAAIDVQFELLGVECRLHTVRRSKSQNPKSKSQKNPKTQLSISRPSDPCFGAWSLGFSFSVHAGKNQNQFFCF